MKKEMNTYRVTVNVLEYDNDGETNNDCFESTETWIFKSYDSVQAQKMGEEMAWDNAENPKCVYATKIELV